MVAVNLVKARMLAAQNVVLARAVKAAVLAAAAALADGVVVVLACGVGIPRCRIVLGTINTA